VVASVTRDRLARDLVSIGVEPGITLVVHSSLSSIGRVVGGAPTVVSALIDVIDDTGTLAMPAATPQCADPASWTEAGVEFDLRTTPTTMGAIPETFRTWPGTLRSDHPLESVCARGPAAAEITTEHPLAFSEGPGTPFGKLHDLDSRILLVGVGFNRCTALHFAESLVTTRRLTTVRFPRSEFGRRVWVEVPNVADDNDTHFPIVGERFVAAGKARLGTIGEADSVLMSMRDLVDFSRAYFEHVL
jgi:aminoglycoside 3-N-acetyltransferase